jgi:hypothetical protein
VLTADKVEQHAHPLRAVHVGTQTELIAEGTAEDLHPSSDPQPARLNRTVALTLADVVDHGVGLGPLFTGPTIPGY